MITIDKARQIFRGYEAKEETNQVINWRGDKIDSTTIAARLGQGHETLRPYWRHVLEIAQSLESIQARHPTITIQAVARLMAFNNDNQGLIQ